MALPTTISASIGLVVLPPVKSRRQLMSVSARATPEFYCVRTHRLGLSRGTPFATSSHRRDHLLPCVGIGPLRARGCRNFCTNRRIDPRGFDPTHELLALYRIRPSLL